MENEQTGNELIKNLKDYFDNYEKSVNMFNNNNKERSKYPCYQPFYNIKEIIRKISDDNGLYLDTKHASTEFTTNNSKKFEPTMAIYYNDESKKCHKGDGIYVYIMYPNNELKAMEISIELGFRDRFKATDKDNKYIDCIKAIRSLIPEEYKEKFQIGDYNIISQSIDKDSIEHFEENLLKIFEIYKIIIEKINTIDGNNYKEKYDNFMESISNGKLKTIDKYKNNTSYNIIYYGIPGSGKSYYIKNELLSNLRINEYERVTFYPEYTYTDFIGTYKITSDKENPIKPEAGPFTRILMKALSDEDNNYALIIEELNRGNAEAIFGDIFQLLDRENGESEYYINNDFIKECMQKEKIKKEQIKIPRNLYIIATINTSDQNVFSLDTAFGRRWDYERVDDNFSIKHDKEKYGEKYIKGFANIKWNDFRTSINKVILEPENNIWNREDKQIGLFYVTKDLLYSEESKQDTEESMEYRKKFVYKVIRYLWFDVFKNEEEMLISALNNTNFVKKEIKICYSFDELAKQIIEMDEI